jgi:hypothetical protein
MSNDPTGSQARLFDSINALRQDLHREAAEGPKTAVALQAALDATLQNQRESLQNQRDIVSQTAQIIQNQTLLVEDLVRRISPLVDELRVDLMERANRHEDKLSAIHDDIAVNSAAADRARRANHNTRDEMRDLEEIVSNMMRQIQRPRL